jgi:hypothetical protein
MTGELKEVQMNTNRFPKLVIGVAIVIFALVVVQVFSASGSANKSNRASTGMGELRRYEGQASSSETGAEASSHPSTGIGELRRYEGEASDPSSLGMGELRRYEALQETQFSQ